MKRYKTMFAEHCDLLPFICPGARSSVLPAPPARNRRATRAVYFSSLTSVVILLVRKRYRRTSNWMLAIVIKAFQISFVQKPANHRGGRWSNAGGWPNESVTDYNDSGSRMQQIIFVCVMRHSYDHVWSDQMIKRQNEQEGASVFL